MSDLILKTEWKNVTHRKLEAVKACHERDVEQLVNLLNAYMSAKSRKRARTSEKTRKTYEFGLRCWIDFCWPDPKQAPAVPLLRATADDVDHFVAHLQTLISETTGRPLAPSTITTYLASVRAFYRALVWTKAMDSSPAEGAHAPGDPRPAHERRPAVEVDAYNALCHSLSGDSPADRRDHLIVRLFGDAGFRVSEVVALDVEDVDLQGGTIFIRAGKGGKSATQFLTRRLQEALERWLDVRDGLAEAGETALLVNTGDKTPKKYQGRRMSERTVRRMLNGLYREAGLPLRFRGTHTLRHTAGTRYYRATKDLHRTREFMRHANISTTVTYAKMDREMVREGVKALDEE